jgi:outer membrane protein assembly factor BamA
MELLRPFPRIALIALALTMAGCVTVPKGRIAVDRVKFEGNDTIPAKQLQKRIATKETRRFLGVARGLLYDYELFNRHVLERDLQRIERFYRARGYYQARARAGRVFHTASNHVRVEIVIEEGEPVVLRRVDVHGVSKLDEDTIRRALRSVDAVLVIGKPFEEESFAAAEANLKRAFTDHGYAYADVKRSAEVDLPRHSAAVGFWVVPGRMARYGEVKIVGLGDLPEAPVRRALDIRPGDPYSTAEIEEAKRALLNLGVFGAVEIEPDLAATAGEQPERVPLLVKVEPAKLRALHLGGGLQLDVIKTDVHLTAGWESRNFLGGLRKMQVELTPGLVFYPTRIPTFQKPERLLPQARLRSEFRQPGLFEARTNAFVRGEFSVYPVLLSAEVDPDAPILGYRDARAGLGLDRSLWRFYGALSQNLQLNSPFMYLGNPDPDLHSVLVSYPELVTSLDLRNDQVHPHEGAYLINTLQVAGVGGDARDIKVQPEARGYVPLDDDVTLALRATVGFLFPDNYGETLVPNALFGIPGAASRETWVRDVQILFLRGFFGGGTGSNRGYGPREIGPHGVVPFYNPSQSPEQLVVTCDPASPDYESGSCDLPLGGLTLWEASVELRYPIGPPLFGAVFVDSGDVSPYRANFRFDRPHLSLGLGFRYDTQVGPIRFDAGYRLPILQADSPDEIEKPVELFGLPIALSFGIGESF